LKGKVRRAREARVSTTCFVRRGVVAEVRDGRGGTALALGFLRTAPAEAPREGGDGMTVWRQVVAAGLLCGLILGPIPGARANEVGGRVDLNTASAAELANLPGIGPAKAQAIVEFRAKEPFTRTDDLRKVKGIGDKLYDSIKDQISVGDAPAPKGRGG
jgi:competence protein ComEA